MKRSRKILLGVFGLFLVCIVLSLLGYLLYGAQRSRAMEQRPLVLIHAPLNREQVSLGRGIMLHASARSPAGVARVELWVDGAFVVARESPEEGPPSILVLSASWEPVTLGAHTVLVRAVSAGGVEGQATVAVEVIETEEGETLGTIAEEVGADVEGPEEPNPDLEIVPDGVGASGSDEPSSEGSSEPEARAEPPPLDEPPPDPHDEAPGADLSILELIALGGIVLPDSEPVDLHVEALALETGSEYESVHCYVGLAGSDPRWYPDVDGDQSTDEYFAYLGDGSWDIADQLSGPAAPVFTWPGNLPLPIDITCVGMSGGGADAVDLGRLEMTVGPLFWDGITRPAYAEGAEGSFTLHYRVRRVLEVAGRVPKEIEIDYSMTAPTNLRLIHAGAGYFLGWEYEPDDEEEPIDGFRIYLNNTLQWFEPSDSHFTALPDQWAHPPCGDEYDFKVTAYRGTYTDGYESSDSNVVTTFTGEIGDPDCGRTVIVIFETLTTGNLGGDGDRDPGDVGPVYGSFYVNDQFLEFNLRCEANLCDDIEGLNHNLEYGLNGWIDNTGNALPRVVVDVPPGDVDVEVGFDISDEDTGWRNRDDPVCNGSARVEVDVTSSGIIDTSGPADAAADRCRVAYTLRPASGAPVVEPGAPPPLPLLRVENVRVGSDSGLPYIVVRNVGSADWARRDLTVAVERPSGEPIGVYTWPTLDLPPGEAVILGHHELAPDRPLDICVILDPENAVNEEGEETTGTSRRYCQPLPDLVITDVTYDYSGERLLVTVQNRGEGPVEFRNVSLQVTLSHGGPLFDRPVWRSDFTVEPWDSAVLEWPGIGEEQRERMMRGYTATVDYLDSIAETDDDNNEYVVPTGVRLQFYWTGIEAPYDVRNMVEYWFDVYVVSGASRRQVADWYIPQDIDWSSPCNSAYDYESCTKSFYSELVSSSPYSLDPLPIAGDEELEIDVTVLHPRALDPAEHRYNAIYGVEDAWNAQDIGYQTCGALRSYDGGRRYTFLGYSGDQAWSVTYYSCWKVLP